MLWGIRGASIHHSSVNVGLCSADRTPLRDARVAPTWPRRAPRAAGAPCAHHPPGSSSLYSGLTSLRSASFSESASSPGSLGAFSSDERCLETGVETADGSLPPGAAARAPSSELGAARRWPSALASPGRRPPRRAPPRSPQPSKHAASLGSPGCPRTRRLLSAGLCPAARLPHQPLAPGTTAPLAALRTSGNRTRLLRPHLCCGAISLALGLDASRSRGRGALSPGRSPPPAEGLSSSRGSGGGTAGPSPPPQAPLALALFPRLPLLPCVTSRLCIWRPRWPQDTRVCFKGVSLRKDRRSVCI